MANINVRGQPNYKRRLQDYLESILKQDPTFEDHENNSEIHLAIIKGDKKQFEAILKQDDFVNSQLNRRNADGKSPLFLTVELGRQEMFTTLYTNYIDNIDLRQKDTMHGNCVLHMAC